MLFDDFERSRFSGRPVRLYVFTRQAAVWRFAESDTDFEYDGTVYTAAQITRSEIQETVEREKDKLTITFAYLRNPSPPAGTEFPVTQALGDNWFPWPPGDPVGVTCLDAHRGATDAPKVAWSGVVTQPEFSDVELTLTCEPTNGLARARGQGPRMQRGCWKVPYSTGIRGCNMLPADFEVPGTLTYASGVTLKAAAFAASAFILGGGKLAWVDPATGLVERRSIATHIGDTITVSHPGGGLAVALAVVALPTCPRTWDACALRHEHPELHYGGAYYKPVENPEGDSLSWG